MVNARPENWSLALYFANSLIYHVYSTVGTSSHLKYAI
ncbi:hypothetical protein GNIT_2473 [Glaciecola nitratireducens FR1064]|uniref:Uncharacterized protein n=1 Tax=Glaciecola nitratireducens (strain JCM 12485 / KCTC 12276 / FR1064) TaxID=1085623 RepID=G4QLZ9_GLANF|nr:hypothetical protein GNIT_2473 [Glaciecola nitratireducens FR1064]